MKRNRWGPVAATLLLLGVFIFLFAANAQATLDRSDYTGGVFFTNTWNTVLLGMEHTGIVDFIGGAEFDNATDEDRLAIAETYIDLTGVVGISDTTTITYAAGSTALETSLDIDMTSSTVEANNYGIDSDVTQGSIVAAAYLSRGNLQGVRSDCYAIGNIDHVYAMRSGASIAMTANSETNQFYGGMFGASASGAFTLTLNDGLVGFQSTVTVDSGVTDVIGGLVAAAFFNSQPIGKDVTSPTYTIYVKAGGFTDFGQSIQVESNNLTAALRIQATDSAVLPIALQISTDVGTITADIELQNGETIDNATDGTITVTGDLACTVPQSYDALLSSTEVDVEPVADTVLYTVPTGNSCIITKIVIRSANKDLDQATDATSNIGFDAATDLVASADISMVLTGTTTWDLLTLVTPGVMGTTTQELQWHNTAGCTTADSTLQVDVFGYLF